MFVIEVIPLKRGVHVESLSYFSSEAYKLGTILTIPVRKQAIRGVVINTKAVSGAKTALRAATFSLRKLPVQEQTSAFSSAFMKTAHDLAEYYACQTGAVIHALLPSEVRDGKIALPHTQDIKAKDVHVPEILQGTLEERFLAYRSLVRETLAHSESILLIVPSSIEAEVAKARLGFGIEDRVIVLTSTIGLSSLRNGYQKLDDFSKTKLIIATPSHAILERHDISMVIMESERSGNYRARTRPYFDYRTVLKIHARHTGRRTLYSDLLIRSEEETLRREDVYATYGETPKRLSLPGTLNILTLEDKPEPTVPFRLFSPKVLRALDDTLKAKGRTFLFAARRGLAPVVACIDCGHIFYSPDSGAPYSLIRTIKDGEEQRWFVCGVSGHRERAADVCPDCGGWRLRERGIGIQHVYDELTKERPGAPIILFDHTSASTYKKATFLQKKFYDTKGAIMLGTQMALPYLTEPITTSVVVNMDALRATPTWHQQEETLALLLHLREHTTDTVYIQTRTESDELMEYAKSGSLSRFYDEEIELRKTYNYPPFSHFIHLTWQGTPDAVEVLDATTANVLKPFNPTFYNAPPSPKGKVTRYGLIRVPREQWPHASLVAALRTLPPSIRIVMNPARII